MLRVRKVFVNLCVNSLKQKEMEDIFTVEFAESFRDLSGFETGVRYSVAVRFTTPDKNGEQYDKATIEPIPETFQRVVGGGHMNPFDYLKPESEIPHFYARIRESARNAYVVRRAQIQ